MMLFHFIRPLWLLTFLPLLILAWCVLRQTTTATSWSKVCDEHLLPYLIQTKGYSRRSFSWGLIFLSAVLVIIGLAGPTWSRLPVPTYQQIQPRVVLLDMSNTMLVNDLAPNRLERAKFKLHDLFLHRNAGQFGLVVYTGEPFVVSPLTDDGQTIDALLSMLTPDIMPVEGQDLASALQQAGKLITQAGFSHGQVLVLTASRPSADAMTAAKMLSRTGIDTSVIPIVGHDVVHDPIFAALAKAGHGQSIPFSDVSKDIDQWLAATRGNQHYMESLQNEIPLWRDQGRWFLIPALLFMLPVFRRGWLQRLSA